MSRIDEMIQRLCPDGVEYKKLGEVIRPCFGERITKTKAKGTLYPVYGGGGESFRTDNYNREDDYVISRFAISPVNVRKVEGKFWLLDSGFTFEVTRDFCDKSYVAQYLFSAQDQIYRCTSSGAQKNLQVKKFLLFEIPVPPLEIQREIVRVLDSFTELKAELETELETRGTQYAHYRDELLSRENLEAIAGETVLELPLAELAVIGTGSHDTKDGLADGVYACYARGVEPMRLNEWDFDETAIITAGDGAGVGKVFHYVEGKYALHQRAYRIVPDAAVLCPRYFFHVMQNSFYDYIMKNAVQGSVASIRRRMLDKFPVLVPPLHVQWQVTSILDRFDALTTSLTDGLPAEIEARRKQYEYYRDKLLDFPRKEA